MPRVTEGWVWEWDLAVMVMVLAVVAGCVGTGLLVKRQLDEVALE